MGFLDWFDRKSEQFVVESFFKQANNIYQKWYVTFASHGSDNPHMFACLKTFEIHSNYYKLNQDQMMVYAETIPFNALSKEEGLELLPYLLAFYTKRDFSYMYYSTVSEKVNKSVNLIFNDSKYLEIKSSLLGNVYVKQTVWFEFLESSLKSKF